MYRNFEKKIIKKKKEENIEKKISGYVNTQH